MPLGALGRAVGLHHSGGTLQPMASMHISGEDNLPRLANVKRMRVVESPFVEALAPGLDAVTREVFAQLGEEYFELCEWLFAQDSDFSLT